MAFKCHCHGCHAPLYFEDAVPLPQVCADCLHDEIDEDQFDDEEEDREADCGRWDNGRLVHQCRLAGSEWCDWECLIGIATK